MERSDSFNVFISRRNDVDVNGFFDVVAHGNAHRMEIQHGGISVMVDHRVVSKLLKHNKNYSGQGIRLLSCNTGKLPDGFAQNLANKLGVPVLAPTDLLWVKPSGKHYVTAGFEVGGHLTEDFSRPGKFKAFYPRRRRK